MRNVKLNSIFALIVFAFISSRADAQMPMPGPSIKNMWMRNTASLDHVSTSQVSHAITVPSTQKGGLLAMGILTDGATTISSITDNAGNTWTNSGGMSTQTTNGTWHGFIYFAANSKAGATTVTVTASGSCDMQLWFFEVAGADPSSPIINYIYDTSASPSVSFSASTLTTTRKGFALTVVYSGDNVSSVAAPYVLAPILTGNTVAYNFVAGPGTYGPVVTQANSAVWSTISAIFK